MMTTIKISMNEDILSDIRQYAAAEYDVIDKDPAELIRELLSIALGDNMQLTDNIVYIREE
jgi:hypothetical protein